MATQKIEFDDGRKGFQVTDDDGDLCEVVVTQEADGRKCRHVYAQRSDLMARVFSLADLHGSRWHLTDDEYRKRSEIDRKTNDALPPIC